MKIEILSDFNCPFCYIGETTLNKVLKENNFSVDVEIIHRTYQLDPYAPKKDPVDSATSLAQKYGVPLEQATQMIESVVQKAKAVGLDYNASKVQATHTLIAHRLAKLVSQETQSLNIYQKLYEAYFSLGKNLSDIDQMVELAVNEGCDPTKVRTALEGSDFLKECLADQQRAKELKITGVPHFVINQKFSIHGAQTEEHFIQLLKQAALEEIKQKNRE